MKTSEEKQNEHCFEWDSKLYGDSLKKFEISPDKRVKELSRGMKLKFMLAVTMSRHAKLLILDER